MAYEIQLRRDTAANWTAANPTLAEGEIGYETDTAKFKIGDGATAWSGLSYFSSGGSAPDVTDGTTTVTTPSTLEFPAYSVSDDAGNAKITLADILFVPDPTGVAATDTAAIQAAHDALPSTGGIVQLGRGTYSLDPSSPLVFTKPIYLRGHGMDQTILSIDTTTVNGIESQASYCTFEDFRLVNTSASPPTAGSGIYVGTTGGGNLNRYNRLYISGFYNGLYHGYGYEWVLRDSHIAQFQANGVYIANADNTDGGDMLIEGCTIYCSSAVTTGWYGVHWYSGGGLRFVGNKINNGGAAGNGTRGIFLAPGASITTSVAIFGNNSIENVDVGIYVAANATGVFNGIVISGNEFHIASTSGGFYPIVLYPSSTGRIASVSILGNVLWGGDYGIQAGNIDSLKYGPNIYRANGTGAFLDQGGNTNVTAVGGG